jgi:hypothetical protein
MSSVSVNCPLLNVICTHCKKKAAGKGRRDREERGERREGDSSIPSTIM